MSRLATWFLNLLSVAALAGASSGSAAADQPDGRDAARWTATWATGPAGPAPGDTTEFSDQTVRYIVHTSVGGDQVRVKISNTFGTTPLVIGRAHIARPREAAAIDPRTDRTLRFSGIDHVTVPAGALVLSDPVDLRVAPLSDLAISLYLPDRTTPTTMHALALQTGYVAAGRGDHTADADLPGAATTTSWHFLTGVDVRVRGGATIVALGDSITDGANSTTDANLRWPDVLAERLQERHGQRRPGVINQGIIGNRLLHPTGPTFANLFGPAALARFDRDVLAQAGVTHVIVLLGINDIGHPGSAAPVGDEVTAEEIAAALTQLAERAHERGIRIIGATLLPFEGTTIEGFFSPEKEVKRQAVNRWIRTTRTFDAVIDFDRLTRDPPPPARLRPDFDGGDHLHPSDAGHEAMGNAIPLGLFDGERD
jgi:lysophospholipase L1-like esterase